LGPHAVVGSAFSAVNDQARELETVEFRVATEIRQLLEFVDFPAVKGRPLPFECRYNTVSVAQHGIGPNTTFKAREQTHQVCGRPHGDPDVRGPVRSLSFLAQ
jgi:hypothetical protein